MEAAHRGEDPFPGKLLQHPPDNVDNPPVAARVEDHQAPLPLQHQGLLMPVVVGDKIVLPPFHQQVGGLAGEGGVVDALGDQPGPLQQGVQVLHLHKAVPGVLPDVPADANEAIGVRVFGEVGPRRSGAEVHPGLGVDLEEPAQAVGVVVVAVGQGGQLHSGQVHPQGPGVVGKFPGGAGVQQQLFPPVLDVQGQAVLRRQAAALQSGVFHQNGDFHRGPSFFTILSGPGPSARSADGGYR